MVIFHCISSEKLSSNHNSQADVLLAEGPISFDGVYYSVYLNQYVLEGKDVILFVTGDYVGGDNSFDTGQPFEKFCDWNQIMELVTIYGCKLGWHTKSHRDLTTLTGPEIASEITPPFPMDYLAYPYGKFNEQVLELTRLAGYKEAFSVTEGDDSPLQRLRRYV